MEEKQETKLKEKNSMRDIEIEKMVLNCGGTEEKLARGVKLLGMISGMKIKKLQSKKRIPAFNVRPGLETGCMVTIRGKELLPLLKRFFETINSTIKKKAVQENQFSFGIEEYIEVPGLEYDRDIGIMGFETSVVFKRKGKRVKMKKIKKGKYPKRQGVSKEEIIEFLQTKLGVEVI